jgi:GNAT superfamily N-acetyltransferase
MAQPRPRAKAKTPAIRIVPANKASWEDLELLFGGRGDHRGCFCQKFKLNTHDWFYKQVSVAQRMRRLREQTRCGEANAAKTSGLVAYLDGEPVGWCNVEPRSAFIRLGQTPWTGRDEDPRDESVWCVACFHVRQGFRRQHITYELARAAVEFARKRGAHALEGYAMITEPGKEITWGEVHVGARNAFLAAGFTEVKRPSKRRAVMRIDF